MSGSPLSSIISISNPNRGPAGRPSEKSLSVSFRRTGGVSGGVFSAGWRRGGGSFCATDLVPQARDFGEIFVGILVSGEGVSLVAGGGLQHAELVVGYGFVCTFRRLRLRHSPPKPRAFGASGQGGGGPLDPHRPLRLDAGDDARGCSGNRRR
jgi:hypothetical protein